MAKTVIWGRAGVKPLALGDGAGRIAVPVVGQTAEQIATEWALAAAAGADLIEWRIDCAADPDLSVGRALRTCHATATLTTIRRAAEGGRFQGPPESYRALVAEAASWADAVDIEHAAPGSADLTLAAQESGAQVVLSHHVFDRVPELGEIQELLAAMAEHGDVAKVAWMVASPAQTQVIVDAGRWAEQHLPVPAVVIAMGELGATTRLGDCARRSAFTFAVGSHASAPGQLSIDEVRASLV